MTNALCVTFRVIAGLAAILGLLIAMNMPRGFGIEATFAAVVPSFLTALASLWMGEVIGTLGQILVSLKQNETLHREPSELSNYTSLD